MNKIRVLTLTVALLLTTTAAATAEEPRHAAGVSGSARVHYAYSPDDDIRFRFDAHAAPYSRPTPEAPGGLPTDARGTVRFSHARDGVTYTAEAEVDCLLTGGPVATLTAVLTGSSHGRLPIGARLGFSVLDGRPDRMGFSWGVADGTDLRPCLAPAPFAPVVEGGFRVRHGDLPPLP
ncbi:hypothetical protein [Saccharothrix syringae]|uniref:Repetin n=1 Tax=Saccharothrix syringae TaxID=103733 RepID=A0A5Q0GTH7_SACSY|nr:hypothetical protein [Saccharothrix syringae]QFZ17211.1 hypothetical protein EKG83_06795 [Saccharothrix syringae]